MKSPPTAACGRTPLGDARISPLRSAAGENSMTFLCPMFRIFVSVTQEGQDPAQEGEVNVCSPARPGRPRVLAEVTGRSVGGRLPAGSSADQSGEYRAGNQVGTEFSTKSEVKHAVREVCEFLGIIHRFPVNTCCRLDTTVDPEHSVVPDSTFLEQASFYGKKKAWDIITSNVLGRRQPQGQMLGNDCQRCAYTSKSLGDHVVRSPQGRLVQTDQLSWTNSLRW